MDEIVSWWPDWLPTALQSADSAIAIIAGVAAVVVIACRFIMRRWRKTARRRRAQTVVLDELTCGCPLAYAEARLGLPKYITPCYTGADGPPIDERLYRLPGAWVMLRAPADVVTAFSITITDADMYYDTAPLTLGSVSVRLGRDTFDDAPPSGSDALDIYAHLATFVRYYDHGCNAAGNQYIWLAHNGVGAGVGSGIGGDVYDYRTGAYAQIRSGQRNSPPDLSAITVNTITIATYGSQEQYLTRAVHGPHPADVRRG